MVMLLSYYRVLKEVQADKGAVSLAFKAGLTLIRKSTASQ